MGGVKYILIVINTIGLILRKILRCILFPHSILATEVGETPDLWWFDLIFNELKYYETPKYSIDMGMFYTKKYCYSSDDNYCISVYPYLKNGKSAEVYDIDRITLFNPLLYEFAKTKLDKAIQRSRK